jgi:DNA polymerase III delta' subunit
MDPAELGSFRLAQRAPWLAAARAQVALAIGAGRLPHALLLQGQPGLGKAALADWIARLALCEAPAADPCGACTSCRLHAAATHPDLRRVGLVEDKKQIAVEDIRELIVSLALKSFRGGRKAAIVDPADALNASGANALLKTLEEPSAGALLVLTVARPERLPATIASRCQRLKIAPPAREAALIWLAEVDPAPDWAGPLSLAAGAPVAALRLVAAGASDLEREMAELPTSSVWPSAASSACRASGCAGSRTGSPNGSGAGYSRPHRVTVRAIRACQRLPGRDIFKACTRSSTRRGRLRRPSRVRRT